MEKNIDYAEYFKRVKEGLTILASKQGSIINAKILTFGDSRGESATLLINNTKLKCFFPDYSWYGWNELDNKNQLTKLNGKIIKIFLELFLLTDNDVVLGKPLEKKLLLVRPDTIYEVNGQLLEKIPEIENTFVLDCGYNIYIKISKYNKFKSGDWINAKGRLDAYLVGNNKNLVGSIGGSQQ